MSRLCDWEGCFEPGVKKVERWETTGRRNTFSHYSNNHNIRSNRISTSGQHSNRAYLFCSKHYFAFVGREKSKRRGMLMLVLLVIGGFVAYTYFTPPSRHHSTATSTLAAAASSGTSDVNKASDSMIGEPLVSKSETQPDVQEASDAPPPEVADSIREATLKALNSGSAGRWHKSHWSGYASVSAIQETNGNECRNAYATEGHKDTKLTTPTTQWCRKAGGDWAEQ